MTRSLTTEWRAQQVGRPLADQPRWQPLATVNDGLCLAEAALVTVTAWLISSFVLGLAQYGAAHGLAGVACANDAAEQLHELLAGEPEGEPRPAGLD